MKLQGVYTALITPFTENGLDTEGLRQNIQYQIKNGIDGIVLIGTTAESPTLSTEEKDQIIRIGIEEAKGKCLVMVGTGSNCTKKTIAATQKAKELGVDCALVITPYYNRPTQDGIFQHFSAIANSVDLPLVIYNHEKRTGSNIEVETVVRIAEIPTVIGVKEANNDMNQMQETIERLARPKRGFSVLSGCDMDTLPTVALGGDGIISVVSNLVPDQMKQLTDTALRGDMNLAREIHYHLSPLFKASGYESNPIPIKAAMEMCGFAAGPCRAPLGLLQPQYKSAMREVLEKLELLKLSVR